tara:strand:+ start:422 stop:625 length:204 start_codon:yes stop_codon:yes gene_type:complete
MKKLFGSRTIWGALVTGVAVLINAFFGEGTFTGAETAQAVEGLTAVFEVIGLGTVVWGRIVAKGPIT